MDIVDKEFSEARYHYKQKLKLRYLKIWRGNVQQIISDKEDKADNYAKLYFTKFELIIILFLDFW